MKILVVGGGGREHTIIWKLSQSDKITTLYCAPGNGGISQLACCVDIEATDIVGMVNFAKEKSIDMVMVAPDNPLSIGMVDALQNAGIRAFGPLQNAAMIESSKAFSKDLMRKYNIPTADFEIFSDIQPAVDYINKKGTPIVVKASGLALGKGVVVAQTVDEAIDAVHSMMSDRIYGEAGSSIVIEECLFGREVSVLAFTDGETVIPMASAQDHKRVFDGDKGLNTGGMGTFSPSKYYTDDIAKECMDNIYIPTIKAMQKEGCPFSGVLYFGLIMTAGGVKVIEYNARFGDPETQVVLPKLKTDLVDIFNAVIDKKLHEINIEWNDNACVCVILASGGYPLSYKTGYEITGVKDALSDDNIEIFHSGTKIINDKLYTAGGRVLGVTAICDTMENARKKAYAAVEKISFEGMHYRKDIGSVKRSMKTFLSQNT